MAVAETCVIKSFGRSYISCNLYYSKLCYLIPAGNRSYKKDFIYKVIPYFCHTIIDLLYRNSIYARLLPNVSGYMDFYISHISASFPKDADLIERALFPCPRGTKKHPIPCPAAENGVLVLFTLYFLRSPISFFSSLKKLSTSANC